MVVVDENKDVSISVTRDYKMGQRKSVPQPPPLPPPPPSPPPQPPGQSVSDKLVNHMITNTATSDYRNYIFLCSKNKVQ